MNKASGIIALLFLTPVFISYFLVKPLRLPFEVPATLSSSTPVPCGNYPFPVKDLNFNSVYDQNDKTRSLIDPDAQSAYKKSVAPVNNFESFVIRHANGYFRTGNPAYASCAIDALEDWARNDALLGHASEQGIAVRKWALASAASAYGQIASNPDLPHSKKRTIEAWLEKTAHLVMADYSRDTSRTSRQNNHLYWAGWSVAITGIAVHDRTLLAWGLWQGRKGTEAINDNGTLDLELSRGSKAQHYHFFAATPLFTLARSAKNNHIHFDDQNLQKLTGLLSRAKKDPTLFRNLTGVAQSAESRNEFFENRIGGDVRLLYHSPIVK